MELLEILKQIWANNSSEIALIALTLLGISDTLPFVQKIKANGIVQLILQVAADWLRKTSVKK